MDMHIHSLSSLFDQLGLDSDDSSIENFVDFHKPIPGEIELHKATFWSESQASFLEQMKNEDADWSGIIDQLNLLLRKDNYDKKSTNKLIDHD